MDMRYWVLVFLLVIPCAAADEDKETIYELNEGGVVFLLREEQLAAEPGYGVSIGPDGAVNENGEVLPARLSSTELQALIRFADKECKVFDYDAKAVRRAIGKAPVGCGVGATTTAITITLKGRTKSVRVPLLRFHADRIPGNKMLQSVLALNDRLRLEASLAKHGGRKAIERLLAEANKRLKKRFPKEKPFRIEEFRGVSKLPPQGEGSYPDGWDPNDRKLEGTAATFQRFSGTPQRILTAIVTTDGKTASVNLQK